MTEAQGEKELLATVFRRRGSNGRYTRLFDDLDEGQKAALQEHATMDSDELPIIGSIETSDQWLVLTTKRLVWRRRGATTTLPIHEIVDAIADLHALQFSGTPKGSMKELQIKTKDARHSIEVEPGAPLSGVWNVLKAIGTTNRRVGPTR